MLNFITDIARLFMVFDIHYAIRKFFVLYSE